MKNKKMKFSVNRQTPGPAKDGILQVTNNGPEIIETNYFDLEAAAAGKFFVSINAACFRVLVPEVCESTIPDMKTATEAIISRGPWPAERRKDGFEILFDDHTESPFALHLSPESFDRLPAQDDAGRGDLKLSVWVAGPRKVIELPARYRIVRSIPFLKPWESGN